MKKLMSVSVASLLFTQPVLAHHGDQGLPSAVMVVMAIVAVAVMFVIKNNKN